MQKIAITQEEINSGSGNFHEYMRFVAHRLTAKSVDPRFSLFAAADIIEKDGYTIEIGSNSDDAGISVRNWLTNFYGERKNISYCLPPVAYQISGVTYLLRMPIWREEKMQLSQAVIDLTEEAEKNISEKTLVTLESDYNEFYDALYAISKLDTTVVTHLETAAHRIFHGAAHYAAARWESLHFVEKAMKEILKPLGVELKGNNGHDIRGDLHETWVRTGKAELPTDLLESTMCTANMRYEKTPQPYLATLRAHHASIRLGALIAKEAPEIEQMGESLAVDIKEVSRDATLSMARIVQAIDPLAGNWPPVQLLRAG